MRQLLAMKVGPPVTEGQSRDANWSVRLSGRLLVSSYRVGKVLTNFVMKARAGGAGRAVRAPLAWCSPDAPLSLNKPLSVGAETVVIELRED